MFATYRLDLKSHQLYRGSERIPLPARAGHVLSLLVLSHGTLVSREQISDQIWGSQQVDFESSLNTAIRTIRRALTDEVSNPSFIETTPRYGYRFLQTPEFSDTLGDTSKQNRAKESVSRSYQKYITVALVLAAFAITTFFLIPREQPSNKNEELAARNYVTSPGYEDFLHGRYAQSRGETEIAEARLTKAIKVDPSLAPAYVSLARINVGNRKLGWHKILAAQGLANKAIEIDANLVAAHVLKAGIALYYWRDRVLAQMHVEKALSIAPNDPDSLVVKAYLNVIEGKTNIALQAIAKAHQLRPLSATLNADYGWVLYKAGSWNDAERLCKTSVELNGRSQFALDCVIHINHSQGDHAEAAEFGLHLMELRGAAKHEIDGVREMVDAKSRESAYWEWTLKWLDVKTVDISDARSKKGIALTMLGRYDEAIEIFEEAYDRNGEPFLAFLAVDPRVDDLRTHLRFAALATRSRLPLSQLEQGHD